MRLPLRQRLLMGHGAPSDDTLQSYLVACSLASCKGDLVCFQRRFARSLRSWFLSIPPGIGLATVKACVRLCIGFPPSRSGVASAGNGAAMRSAVIGAWFCHDETERIKAVEASCTVTHTHALALQGAQLIALAAALSATERSGEFTDSAQRLCPDWPWKEAGTSGYVVHSVNSVLCLWQSFGSDPVRAIEEAIRLGGDTDTIGAMLGGILGAGRFTEWPSEWLRVVGVPSFETLTRFSGTSRPPGYFGMLGWNLLTLPTILLFGFRRLLPPY